MSDVADHDHREREPKDGEYRIPVKIHGDVVGHIVCIRPGLRLIDFYRTSSVMAKDVPPKVSGGKGGVE